MEQGGVYTHDKVCVTLPAGLNWLLFVPADQGRCHPTFTSWLIELANAILAASFGGFLFGGFIGARHAGDKFICTLIWVSLALLASMEMVQSVL